MSASHNPHTLVKFRPVLTLSQLQHIAYLCKLDGDNLISQGILKVMVPMIAKVEVGAINPAYKLSETHMIKQAETSERMRYENNLMSPEEEAAYEEKIMGI